MSWPTQFLTIGNKTIPTEEFVKDRENILAKYSNPKKPEKWQMLHKEDIQKKEMAEEKIDEIEEKVDEIEEKKDEAEPTTAQDIIDSEVVVSETVGTGKTTDKKTVKKAKRWK